MKKGKLTPQQRKFLIALEKGKSMKEAALYAGYSDKNPNQSAQSAITYIKKRMPEVLEDLGLTMEVFVRNHLIPMLHATETKFFPYTKTVKRKVEQHIEEREVISWGARGLAIDITAKLGGWYAPRQVDLDPDKTGGVRVIDISAIPQYRELAE